MITLKSGNTLGFDEVVDTLDDALGATEIIHDAAEDGIGLSDIGAGIKVAPILNEIRKDSKTFVAQLEDLTAEESKQVALALVAKRGGDVDTIVQKALGAVDLLSRWYTTGVEVAVLVQDTIDFGKNLFRKAA